MTKSAEAFRTITEVADLLQTPTHVLRFWEGKFPQVKPVKRAGGRRYYRPADVALLAGIKHLLHEDGLTIRGVQKMIKEQGVRVVTALGAPELAEGAEDEAHPAEAEATLPETFSVDLPEALAENGAEAAEPETEAPVEAITEAEPSVEAEAAPEPSPMEAEAPDESLEPVAEPDAMLGDEAPAEAAPPEPSAEAVPLLESSPEDLPQEPLPETAAEPAEAVSSPEEEPGAESATEPVEAAPEPIEPEPELAEAPIALDVEPEPAETVPADPAYGFVAPRGPARAPLPEAEAVEAPQDEPAAAPPRSGWQQGSLFELLVLKPEPEPEPAPPEIAVEAEPAPAEPVPEAPMALDVEPEPDPLARVVSLIIGGAAPVSSALAEAVQIDPERDRLRVLRDQLPVLIGAELSPIERMRLMSARDRLVALKTRLAQPPRKPKS